MMMDTFWFVSEKSTKEMLCFGVSSVQEVESFVAVTNTRGLSFSPIYSLMGTAVEIRMWGKCVLVKVHLNNYALRYKF